MSQPKIILITGAAHGIGRATAVELARRGHAVIATDIDEYEMTKLHETVVVENLNIKIVKSDITNKQDVEKLVLEHSPDVLINNAGIGEVGPLAEIPMERVRKNYEVNVFGTLMMTQAFAPKMIDKKTCRIIMVSSVSGLAATPFFNPYSSTKFALESLSDSLRQELAPLGIKVSIIEPGAIRNGHNEKMMSTKYEWVGTGSRFAKFIPFMKSLDNALIERQHPVDSVVRAMIHAVESPRPKIRYVMPWQYKILGIFIKILPARFKDLRVK